MFSKAVKSLKMFLAVLLLLSSVKVFANGVETHDGFFFRGLLGLGPGETVEKDVGGSDLELSGKSYFGVFQIGGAVTENLIIFYEQSGFILSDPDVEWDGNSFDEGSVFVSNVGIGASYYFMPVNIYVSMSLCTSRAELELNGDSDETERGFGTNIIVGKEWWVSANWGLGVAGVFHYSKMEYKNDNGTKDVENRYYGIAFSATYN